MGGLPLRIDQLGCCGEAVLTAVCGLIVLLGVIAAWRYSSSTGTESLPLISVFASFALAAAGRYRFQDDSETTVNQLGLSHIGISGVRLARHKMHAVNPIHVRIAAIRIQEPPVFVAKTFFDPAFLLRRKHFNVRCPKLLRERARQDPPQPVVVNVREKMRIFR